MLDPGALLEIGAGWCTDLEHAARPVPIATAPNAIDSAINFLICVRVEFFVNIADGDGLRVTLLLLLIYLSRAQMPCWVRSERDPGTEEPEPPATASLIEERFDPVTAEAERSVIATPVVESAL